MARIASLANRNLMRLGKEADEEGSHILFAPRFWQNIILCQVRVKDTVKVTVTVKVDVKVDVHVTATVTVTFKVRRRGATYC